ncbi:MAG: 5'-3' exonuclease H3TH domain-containing protein [Candidatus Limnocylindrales bacterium]
MELHLVDATYELFRAHYSPRPPVRAPDGRDVGAVTGLVYTLLTLLRDEGATHVGCATDHVIRSFRNGLYDGYKTEAGVPAELLAQFSLAERAMEALGVVVWPMVEFEADDALATAAARWGDRPGVDRIWICTPDKDLAQCVRGDRVVMRDRRRERTIDEAGVRERWGVAPESIPDYLALVGDSADGFPGLAGWGARSAAAVLARFGHLEEIPAAVGEWHVDVRSAVALNATLRDRPDEARLYRQLATLRLDVPLPQTDPEELRWRGARRGPFTALCDELGARALADRPHLWQD